MAALAGTAWIGTLSSGAEHSAAVGPGCAVDPSGLIGWWRGQDELAAEVGPDLTGDSGFVDARVRRGFVMRPDDALSASGLPTVGAGVSVVAWVRPDVAAATSGRVQTLISRWDDPTADDHARSFSLRLDPFGVLTWSTDDTTSRRPLELRAGVPQVLDGDWHHVAATWDATAATVYLDGVEVATVPSQGGTLEPADGVALRIGAKGGLGPSFAYEGSIDEPAVFARALDATEVAAIVAAGADGICDPAASRVRLSAPVPAGGDGFGYRVAIDGDTVAVGATADLAGTDSGSVVVVDRTSSGWAAAPAFVAADTASGDGFGDAVAIDGDTLVVGAPFDGEAGTGAGAAYVFVRSVTGWTEEAELVGADTAEFDGFGASVAIDGDTLVIGASGDDDATGSAYVFGRGAGGWTEQAVLRAAGAEPIDLFGASVAIDGDTIVVGVPNDSNAVPFAGSARVFSRTADPAVWDEVATLVDPSSAIGSFFGWSVSAHDGRVLVGSQRADDAAGVAHVFRRDGGGWVHAAELPATDPEAGDLFGISVALGSDTAVVGAVWDDDNGGFSGTVWAFRRTDETWALVGRPIDDALAGDRAGSSVAFDGDTVVAGSPGATVTGMADAGVIDIVHAP